MENLIWFTVVFSGGFFLGLIVSTKMDNYLRQKLYRDGFIDGKKESNKLICKLRDNNQDLFQKIKSLTIKN